MIGTTRNENKDLKFRDNAEDLKKDIGPEMIETVKAAMKVGLTEFTVPTVDDNEARMNWKVRKWFTKRGDTFVCFLVAYQEENAHLEIIGHELALGGPVAGETKDVKKAA